MDRRAFVRLLGAGAIATPLGAFAQPIRNIRKIGVLNALPREAPLPQAFLRGLRDLGYIEGKNIIVEYRSGPYGDFPALADDLVKLKVDVIYAVLEQAALAARKATTTIPIVFAVIGDPVRSGLVASLAHPGGNATGLTAFGADLGGKRLELLKELIPRLSRVGVLWNPATSAKMPDGPQINSVAQVGLELTEAAGRALGVQVQSFPVRRPSELNDALGAATRERIGALIVEENSLTYSERNRIVEFTAAHGLPAIYGYRDYVVSGGLISYGANLPELMHRAMAYIDKILKGAKPSDLPVEQPTKFELVINAKTAKALGLTIPQTLLLRADEVIQ
jgi:putative tryptophan/tyrosine transport system substrate-binding protein